VGLTWAKVREITDVESSIGAVCARTGDRGVLEGDFNLASQGRCLLNYLSKDASIVIGDRIEISGTGSVYPQGVYIGKVVEIYDNDSGLTISAVIQSDVDFNALGEVLVGR
jgi:rod shape-determining protein MreC